MRECARCFDMFSDEWEDGVWIYEGDVRENEYNDSWVCNHCHGCIAD